MEDLAWASFSQAKGRSMIRPDMLHSTTIHIPNITPQKTVAEIVKGAQRALDDPTLHMFARLLVRELITKNDDAALAKFSEMLAVVNAVQFRLRYTNDPRNIELAFMADRIFQLWSQYGRFAEDCESTAGIVLALLWSLNHTCAVTLVGFADALVGYDHVFIESNIPRMGWRVADPTEAYAQQMTYDVTQFERVVVRHT